MSWKNQEVDFSVIKIRIERAVRANGLPDVIAYLGLSQAIADPLAQECQPIKSTRTCSEQLRVYNVSQDTCFPTIDTYPWLGMIS